MRWLLLVLAAAVLAASLPAADAPGGLIVYPRKTAGGSALHVMNADGTGDRALPGIAEPFCAFPTWSPDGKRIAFTSGALDAFQNSVAIVNGDGSGLTRLNAPSRRAGLPAWSADGKFLTFSAGDERPDLYLADAQGNVVRKLNPEGTGGVAAFWLRDGSGLGYTRLDGNGQDARMVLIRPDGTELPGHLPDAAFPIAAGNAVSPDGKKLLYLAMKMEDRTASLRLWEFAARSDSLVLELGEMLPTFEGLPLPAWSPDGRWILVPIKTEKGLGLFRVSPDGKEKQRLTPEGVDCLAGSWRAQP